MPGVCRRERSHTAWIDRTPRKKSVRMTEDRDKWREYIHGVANPRIEDG